MLKRLEKPRYASNPQHSIVYRKEDEFCCWPFLCGMWETADRDLLVAFMRNDCSYGSPRDISHDNPERVRTKFTLLRSTDRGRRWDTANAAVLFDLGQSETYRDAPQRYDERTGFDFTDKNVLVASGAFPDYFQPQSRPWIRVSTDGGRNWKAPIVPPMVGLPSLSGHGSPLVRPDGVCLVFMTMVSADGWTRRPVVYASIDEGRAWTFLSFMTPGTDDGAAVTDRTGSLKFAPHRWFDARPLLLPDGRIIASVRCQRDPTSVLWTEMFESEDGGRTWRFLSRVNDWGAPGDLALTGDGRVVCAYSYRHPPYGVRARVSEDAGRTWGSEIIIRDDGGSWDLGYPRVIEESRERILAVYYMNLKSDPVQMNGGVRHIAQTMFTLD
jgi:hypothetical protein